jgi:hypothetical protein
MLLKVSAGGVPAGSYHAKFLGVEVVNNEYGDGLRWNFQITVGDYAGRNVSRTTAKNPTTRNTCGTLLSGIAGKPLTIDAEFEVAAYVGKTYLVVVNEGQTGSTRVDAVTQLPTAN